MPAYVNTPLGTARAITTHVPRDGIELPMSGGQRFTILEGKGPHWYTARDGRGHEGWVPAALIALDRPDPMIAVYKPWKEACDKLMERGNMTMVDWETIQIPQAVIKCEELGCVVNKMQLRRESPFSRFDGAASISTEGRHVNGLALGACVHDLEMLLRVELEYSAKWLTRERNRWHPDQFQKRCAPHARAALGKIATQMFSLLNILAEKEASREEELGEAGRAKEERRKEQECQAQDQTAQNKSTSTAQGQDGKAKSYGGTTGDLGPIPSNPLKAHFNPEAATFSVKPKSPSFNPLATTFEPSAPSFNPIVSEFKPSATPTKPVTATSGNGSNSTQQTIPLQDISNVSMSTSSARAHHFMDPWAQLKATNPNSVQPTDWHDSSQVKEPKKENRPSQTPSALQRFHSRVARYAPKPRNVSSASTNTVIQSQYTPSNPYALRARPPVVDLPPVPSVAPSSPSMVPSTSSVATSTPSVISSKRSSRHDPDPEAGHKVLRGIPANLPVDELSKAVRSKDPDLYFLERWYDDDGTRAARFQSKAAYLERMEPEEESASPIMVKFPPDSAAANGEATATLMTEADELTTKDITDFYPTYKPEFRYRQPVGRMLVFGILPYTKEQQFEKLLSKHSTNPDIVPTRFNIVRYHQRLWPQHHQQGFGIMYFANHRAAREAKKLIKQQKNVSTPGNIKLWLTDVKTELLPDELLPATDRNDEWAKRAEIEPTEPGKRLKKMWREMAMEEEANEELSGWVNSWEDPQLPQSQVAQADGSLTSESKGLKSHDREAGRSIELSCIASHNEQEFGTEDNWEARLKDRENTNRPRRLSTVSYDGDSDDRELTADSWQRLLNKAQSIKKRAMEAIADRKVRKIEEAWKRTHTHLRPHRSTLEGQSEGER